MSKTGYVYKYFLRFKIVPNIEQPADGSYIELDGIIESISAIYPWSKSGGQLRNVFIGCFGEGV